MLRVAHIPTARTAASNSSVNYWQQRTAAAPLKKPDPVVLSIGSTHLATIKTGSELVFLDIEFLRAVRCL